MHCSIENPWTGALWYVKLSRLARAAFWLILLTTAVPGCQTGQKPCEDIAPGAIPPPVGTYLCQWNHAEAARADRDNFVIYRYEWTAEGTKLTSFGQEHLARIADGLPQVCFPVVIEPVADQKMNETRRLVVLQGLANCHVPIMPDRVVLGRSDAEGLYGQEAPGIAARMLTNQGGGGGMGATGGGATNSMGGGAMASGGGAGIY
jgi:uncharacterized membrane protein YgcG